MMHCGLDVCRCFFTHVDAKLMLVYISRSVKAFRLGKSQVSAYTLGAGTWKGKVNGTVCVILGDTCIFQGT